MSDVLTVATDVFLIGTLVLANLIMVAMICFLIKHVWLDASETYKILKQIKRKELNHE